MSSQVGWRARRCVGHHHRVGPGPCGYVLGTRGTFYEAAGAFAHNFTQNEPPATNLNSKFKSEVRKKSSTPPLPYTYKKTGPGHPLWIFRSGAAKPAFWLAVAAPAGISSNPCAFGLTRLRLDRITRPTLAPKPRYTRTSHEAQVTVLG
jgi:hypothetical protein